jgi:hypothetical protein
MIKINDILKLVNDGIKTHYFKDITTYKVAELLNQNGSDKKFPAIYEGNGNYNFIQADSSGLTVYHRITEFDNEEDLKEGFGRNPLTIETYKIKTVFFGSQNAINESCENINFNLAKEFKKLIPRRVDVSDTNRITVSGINYDKEEIKEQEFIESNEDSILFVLDLEIIIKGIEVCNTLNCS